MHTVSAHKVGVDGVLVALWTALPEVPAPFPGKSSSIDVDSVDCAPLILDAGCGCGVISLILAQRCSERFTDFRVDAIDIDEPSVEEASDNFRRSLWSDFLGVENIAFDMLPGDNRYSLIVSNPPYFDAGISDPVTRRERARHCGSLSPLSLIARAPELLSDNGILSMIVPSESAPSLIDFAAEEGLVTERLTWVKGHADAPVKRALLQFRRRSAEFPASSDTLLNENTFVLETAPGVPTPEYHLLGRDFYLYF